MTGCIRDVCLALAEFGVFLLVALALTRVVSPTGESPAGEQPAAQTVLALSTQGPAAGEEMTPVHGWSTRAPTGWKVQSAGNSAGWILKDPGSSASIVVELRIGQGPLQLAGPDVDLVRRSLAQQYPDAKVAEVRLVGAGQDVGYEALLEQGQKRQKVVQFVRGETCIVGVLTSTAEDLPKADSTFHAVMAGLQTVTPGP